MYCVSNTFRLILNCIRVTKVNCKICTKNHAADPKIGFLATSISKTNGCATAMPTAWELKWNNFFKYGEVLAPVDHGFEKFFLLKQLCKNIFLIIMIVIMIIITDSVQFSSFFNYWFEKNFWIFQREYEIEIYKNNRLKLAHFNQTSCSGSWHQLAQHLIKNTWYLLKSRRFTISNKKWEK